MQKKYSSEIDVKVYLELELMSTCPKAYQVLSMNLPLVSLVKICSSLSSHWSTLYSMHFTVRSYVITGRTARCAVSAVIVFTQGPSFDFCHAEATQYRSSEMWQGRADRIGPQNLENYKSIKDVRQVLHLKLATDRFKCASARLSYT